MSKLNGNLINKTFVKHFIEKDYIIIFDKKKLY